MMDPIVAKSVRLLVGPIVVGIFARVLRNSRPMVSAENIGTISPEKISAIITIAVGVLMIAWGLFHSGWGGLIVALLGAAVSIFMAPSLTHIHDVNWNPETIEGPSNLFGLTLGKKRTAIAWPEIIKTGITPTSYWYVETADGRRIYWSYLYKGYGALTNFIRAKRPDLKLQAKMG
jgi:hypothetical protein